MERQKQRTNERKIGREFFQCYVHYTVSISGMKNMQTKLDVIGNNISNVNTYGFKKSRVTFKDAISQTIS